METIYQPFQYRSSRHCMYCWPKTPHRFQISTGCWKAIDKPSKPLNWKQHKTLQQKTVTHNRSGQKHRFCFVSRCYVMFFKTYKTVSTTENDIKERFVNDAICSQFGVDLTNRLTHLPTIDSFVKLWLKLFRSHPWEYDVSQTLKFNTIRLDSDWRELNYLLSPKSILTSHIGKYSPTRI